MGPKPGWIAVGRKPKHVPNNKEEIVRIIEGRKTMEFNPPINTKTYKGPPLYGDPLGMEPIGEKAWPLRMAIPAALKFIGRLYMWGCTVVVSVFIAFVITHYMTGG